MPVLWSRLKERKLVQWALAYLAGAWGLLQVLDMAADSYEWPSLVMRLAFALVALGFLTTLVLAWYHGERGVQKVSGMEVLLLAALLGTGSALLWRFAASESEPLPVKASMLASEAVEPDTAIPEKSVAVLPFANDSGDEDEQYFSDGLSESLITALSQFAELKVINQNSSFRFRDSNDSVDDIARKLGVANLLQGGVRRLGGEVRIRAELVKATDGRTLWSEQYDRPYRDLFKLQDDITESVADALKTRLLATTEGQQRSDRPPSGNLDAYNAYLRGIAESNSEAGVRRAIDLFRKAREIDANYALAYAQEASSWTFLSAVFLGGDEEAASYERADEAIDAALKIDPDLPQANYARGFLLLNRDMNWNAALETSRHLIKLAPQNPIAYSLMSQTLKSVGQADEAVLFARRFVTVNPLSAGAHESLALLLRATGQVEEAEAELLNAIELGPSDSRLHANLTLIRTQRGDVEGALAAAKGESSPFWRGFAMAIALSQRDDHVAADAALEQLIAGYAVNGAYQIAELYAVRGDADSMFQWLERAWTQRDSGIQHLLTDPLILRYQDDPRFAAYCREVGLPLPGAFAPGAPAKGASASVAMVDD